MVIGTTLDLYDDDYHGRLANPGESFVAHYARCYLALIGELDGLSVLEIGCSSGRTSELLLEHGAVLTSVDFDERACKQARERLARFGERSAVLCRSGDQLDDFDAFDKVVMLDFVEHVDDTVLSRILAHLRSYPGPIYVHTPNRLHPYEWAQRLHLVARDPTHINVKSRSQWCNLFTRSGFTIVRETRSTSHPRRLAQFERVLCRVPGLARLVVRSVGFELRAGTGSS